MPRFIPLLLFMLFSHKLFSADDISVYFSPNGGCTQAIVETLASAQHSIYVQAYSFTSKPIAKALVAAHSRGIDVHVLLDKSQKTEQYSSADYLLHSNIPVKIDEDHAIAHNKIIIIDDMIVITGSFNFTSSAETANAENLLVIHRPDIARKYHDNWTLHDGHCQPYSGK